MAAQRSLTEVPTELDVSYLSQSEDSVTARYGWKYSGDLGSVSYFQVVVEVNNVTLCQKKVLKSIQEVTCLLPFKEGDNYTVTVAVVDNCNISGPPLTKMFTAGFDQLSRTDGGSCQCRGCLVWIAVSIGLLLLVAVLVMVIIVALCWCSKCRRDKVSPVELADSKNAALEASAALAKEKENNSALLADIKAAHSNEMERERERAREIAAALQKERQKSKVQYIKDHPAKSPPLNDISPLQSNQLLRISSSEASSPKTPASFSSGDSVNEPLLPKNN
ncbi:hypothetical protein GBAR_LOCUS15745 [Geodia barretti]|uniref:Uncharacterized protein n=1 Tax=Geodia barretti TaxID=519541 RepID=A0AA35WN48_GEOBA|nr:hypothetical protein GBAR_LOCUS15745 [Geodia barretti]